MIAKNIYSGQSEAGKFKFLVPKEILPGGSSIVIRDIQILRKGVIRVREFFNTK